MRGLYGFCFFGATMIVESWLNERTAASSRGRVFGIYTMVNLAAATAGQMVLTAGDPAGYRFFRAGRHGLLLCTFANCAQRLCLAPGAGQRSLNLPALWRNSPVAVYAVFMVGISNASFGALAPVYASRTGLSLGDVAPFVSVPILAAALAQLPIGFLSDRNDRRLVLVGVASLALLADILVIPSRLRTSDPIW